MYQIYLIAKYIIIWSCDNVSSETKYDSEAFKTWTGIPEKNISYSGHGDLDWIKMYFKVYEYEG